MSRVVLVTGAGGPAGVSVIRALRRKGIRVIAADLDPLAVGLRLGDEHGLLPPYSAADFVERLCELAGRTAATALVSTLAEEMLALANDTDRLAAPASPTGFRRRAPSRRVSTSGGSPAPQPPPESPTRRPVSPRPTACPAPGS